MGHSKHSGAANNVMSRQGELLREMISDLERRVQLLDCDIFTEEERSRVSNPADPAYSMLARTLKTRRDNLKSTIAALEQRLLTVQNTSLDRLQKAA
jgi:multidrug resistance efflux pump